MWSSYTELRLKRQEVPVLFKPWRRQRENAARQIIYHPAKAFSIFKRTEQFYIISGASLQQIPLDICSSTLSGWPKSAQLVPDCCSCVVGTTVCLLVLRFQTWEGQLARFLSTGRRRLALQKGPIKIPPWWKERGISGQHSGLRATRMQMQRRLWGFSGKSLGCPRGSEIKTILCACTRWGRLLGKRKKATNSRIIRTNDF